MRVQLLSAALAIVAGLAPYCRASEPVVIKVRVIDARDGKPYANLTVPITFQRANPTGGFRSKAEAQANLQATVRQTTDALGQVSFALPTPTPGVIAIDLPRIGCGPGLFDTEKVIEKGIVGQNRCETKLRKANIKFEAKPGEIVYFAAPIGLLEGALTK